MSAYALNIRGMFYYALEYRQQHHIFKIGIKFQQEHKQYTKISDISKIPRHLLLLTWPVFAGHKWAENGKFGLTELVVYSCCASQGDMTLQKKVIYFNANQHSSGLNPDFYRQFLTLFHLYFFGGYRREYLLPTLTLELTSKQRQMLDAQIYGLFVT